MGVFKSIPVHHLVNVVLLVCMGVPHFGVSMLEFALLTSVTFQRHKGH